ncbi:MAG: bifunctional diaminohydroxyphosphoribosylaminopyrimidine deaminase/5-amino-6-(5-phosphoribosylamino)uracil reductase RibD [Bacteroidales bacterium]|mgnify:CR=1 FL=1|jgi:diaminohydroxyphosphoribosylaminopyrimidine deaminase/5-amino-6-(5-phosphoribosylamino)uracil reductase|nr:bifunctional diaminohydroxyphosphoribosylaminopyrimidine deaminase/5-amino-6-(5-phosphoribosylamino)uracil reductase RibD [Bacteroidales bacterium]MDI9575012.1 bifunctional diaminohydroxyphosphoribosylaminopyrimidine deaminase/5-amino-6-(5-phosphoribosylamino)uracil reductase RibD [Bacteroidota bacterium]HPZ74399.1 bifunctional diaminohydroxyphosphoribosylaminopyrimidine deaminase/5-amino-6-(5-phosphoribosylamino)uracil reductase RibD [Candidatus Pacearchaeota archaeon]MDY0401085.1 bifunction
MCENDLIYMRRCLNLAKEGLGYVRSNPLVGCVIVKDNHIIGEGFHHAFGKPHAEIEAINNVKDKSQIKNSTIYINLEPCSHYGKTPPCSQSIIDVQPLRLVIADIDPNPLVNNKGKEILEKAGIKVDVGLCKNEHRHLNRRFYTFYQKNRPYIILKWAQTLDGFIAQKNQQCIKWISNDASLQLVHKWRTEEMAILVGAETIRCDNPQLTSRHWYGHNPIRLVVTNSSNLPINSNIFNDQAETTIFYKNLIKQYPSNIDLVKIENDFLGSLFAYCLEKNIISILVEGGASTLDNFIKRNLWDEARVIIGSNIFGNGKKAPIIDEYKSFDIFDLEDNKIIHYYNDTY